MQEMNFNFSNPTWQDLNPFIESNGECPNRSILLTAIDPTSGSSDNSMPSDINTTRVTDDVDGEDPAVPWGPPRRISARTHVADILAPVADTWEIDVS